jgi:hypothetical protein
MRLSGALWFAIALLGPLHRSVAADPRYPDWPCAQAKVPEISVAAVWAGPELGDALTKWKENSKVAALAPRLAARRTALEQTQKTITDFLSGPAPDKTELGKLLFAGLFETLNAQRSSVMSGLERVTRKQRQAAEKIRNDTESLQALQDASARDQAKIDELSNQLVWETRIFEDRRRVITYVCEVPTAIDQRLFALSRTIQQELE